MKKLSFWNKINYVSYLEHWRLWQFFALTLSLLAVNFEDRWWPMQTIWIQMKPHKTWGFNWDPNCLTFRLYISKIFGRKLWLFASFERKKYLKKLPSMQRVKPYFTVPFKYSLPISASTGAGIFTLCLIYTVVMLLQQTFALMQNYCNYK